MKAFDGRDRGNVGNIMVTGICVLSMTVVLLSYMNNVMMLQAKAEVGQIAREYILAMETEGYLDGASQTALMAELQSAGLSNITLTGTTVNPVTYGHPVTLKIKGELEGGAEIEEIRTSTAKN